MFLVSNFEERITFIEITAFNDISIYFRIPGFVYPCTCPIGCIIGDRAQCEMNKLTRNNCKMCRYTKCKSAGMVMKWVLSACTPKVEKQRPCRKRKKSSNGTKDFSTSTSTNCHEMNSSSVDETISNMKQTHNQALVIDMTVIKWLLEYFYKQNFIFPWFLLVTYLFDSWLKIIVKEFLVNPMKFLTKHLQI